IVAIRIPKKCPSQTHWRHISYGFCQGIKAKVRKLHFKKFLQCKKEQCECQIIANNGSEPIIRRLIVYTFSVQYTPYDCSKYSNSCHNDIKQIDVGPVVMLRIIRRYYGVLNLTQVLSYPRNESI